MDTVQIKYQTSKLSPTSSHYVLADKDIREAAEILLQLRQGNEIPPGTVDCDFSRCKKDEISSVAQAAMSICSSSAQNVLGTEAASPSRYVMPVYPILSYPSTTAWCYKSPTSASSTDTSKSLVTANSDTGCSPSSNDERREKRTRTQFSKEQLCILEEFHSKIKYPNLEDRLTLQKLTNIPEDRIHVWFQNRRAKDRRDAGRRPIPVENKAAINSPLSSVSTGTESSCDSDIGSNGECTNDSHLHLCLEEKTCETNVHRTIEETISPPKKMARPDCFPILNDHRRDDFVATGPLNGISNFKSVHGIQEEFLHERESINYRTSGAYATILPAFYPMNCQMYKSPQNASAK